jgi:hypothetical protein
MSNLFIREITGTGVFQMPTTDEEIDALNTTVSGIINGIANLTNLGCSCQVVNTEGAASEIAAVVESITYLGSICPNSASLRSAIRNAFLSYPDVTGIGSIDIKKVPEGGFYNRYPILEYVDTVNGVIKLQDNIPPGAQIEVHKYTRHATGDHSGYTSHRGKRYRPDRLLARGITTCDLSTEILTKRRAHYRFAFRWPLANNTGGAGVRGPLSPVTVSTASAREQLQGNLLIVVPSPCGFGKH